MSVARLSLRDVIARRHFPALDGLRAVAVLLVIVGHTGYPIPGVPGDLGVSAFFVLSGFLITRLLIRERESSGSVSLTGFYARRTIRIPITASCSSASCSTACRACAGARDSA